MRLFWKLFCSMVTVTVLACSISGFLLIDGQFRTGLDARAEAVTLEHTLLRRTLLRELRFSQDFDRAAAIQLAESAAVPEDRDGIRFRLSDSEGQTLAGSRLPAESGLTSSLQSDQLGWELLRKGERAYLHAASPITLDDGTIYLENWREAGDLFDARQTQYAVFSYLMLGLILAAALAALAVSAWISRPLRRLSEAARQMAGGDLSQRMEVRGDDEIGQLSRDFDQMADQLQRHMQELTDAARRQEDFLHSFAHETKTPLTSIIGYAELLLSRPARPELVQESASNIFREGRRLERLSHKLLDMVVLEREGAILRPTEMTDFLEQVSDVFRPALEHADIRLETHAEPGTADIEPDLMESVCLNLLDNARKAITGEGLIRFEGIRLDDGYCIQVTDDGRGISPEDIERITEPFYMADKSRSRAQGGAGLGLAVCQRIVALHGGTLGFKSELGRGTCVSVRLKGGAAWNA